MFKRIVSNMNYFKSALKTKNEQIQIFDKSCKYVWIFNTANIFSGNPKWLFIYINKYRKDIDPIWMCDSEETVEYVRKLGYKAYTFNSDEGKLIKKKANVYVVEQVKENIPDDLKHVTYLNLFHGVGCKSIERFCRPCFLSDRITAKYVRYNEFYKNNQLFLVTSELMEKHFKYYCGLDDDKVIRAGYPRCEYNRQFERITTFDHQIKKLKGLSEDAKLAVYCPTFRDASPTNFFGTAIPDMKQLIKKLEANNMLLIFKVHPLMENDYQYLQYKEYYSECKNLLFWDNNNDIYEIMDKIDLAIIDYSSMFYDLLAAGVKNYIRYMFDYNDINFEDFVYDLKEMTCGKDANNFEELLAAIDHYEDENEEDRKRIYDLFWSYADNNTFETIIERAIEFKPDQDTEMKSLYSFDIFDTVFARKVLEPQGIFYFVKEAAEKSGLGFSSFFLENFVSIRKDCEANVREFYQKTLTVRKSDRREITFDEIYVNMMTLYKLTKEQVTFLKEKELQCELDNVIPMYERIAIIEELIADGNTVVLVSDMYLPQEMIKKMLYKANPVLAQLPLFLSSEYGVQKTTAKLYMEVYRSFKPYYNFKEWIHYGDNNFADGKMARKLGITAKIHKTLKFSNYETAITNKIGTYNSFLLAAKMARFREAHYNKKDNFAYAYISLYFVPYVNWAIRDAMERGIDCLYFISRDGYQLKRIADTIIKEKKLDIKTKYIYGSRKAWRVPSFVEEIDDEFFSGFGNFTDIETFNKLLKALCMTQELFDEYFPQLMYIKEMEAIDKQTMSGAVQVFAHSEKYHKYLLEVAANDRKIVLEYLNQEINFEEKFAFVEYWGRGYTQDCFTRLVHAATGKELDVPYYYVRSIYPTQGHNVRYNFNGNRTPLLFVESIFANIPYKSITSYTREDGKVVPVLQDVDCDMHLFTAMKRYLSQFVKDYLRLNVDHEEDFDRALFNFALNYFTENQEDEAFSECLAPLIDSVGTYGEKNEYAPALTDEMLKALENGEKITKMTKSIDMTLARSSEAMVEQYNYLTVVVPEERRQAALAEKEQLKHTKSLEEDSMFRSKINHLNKESKSCQEAYDTYAKTPINDKLIILIASNGPVQKTEFYEIKKLLEKRDDIVVQELPSRRKYTDEELKSIATAKAIIVSKNCIGLNRLSLRKGTKFVQLHESAFMYTRFGLAKENPNAVDAELEFNQLTQRGNYDYLPIASKEIAKSFEAAYGIKDPGVVTPIGNCGTDIYFDEDYKKESYEQLYKLYPQAKGKKIIMYMPYYRYHQEPYRRLEFLDVPQMYSKFKEDYVMLIHCKPPKGQESYHIANCFSDFAYDITGQMPLRQLFVMADVFVGDYRNAFFEAPLLHKPIFMTASDHIEFTEKKQVNYEYEDIAMGPIVYSTEELILNMSNLEDYDYDLQEEFKDRYLTNCDGKASERLLQLLEK
ncbi:MAG: CDP-glycerol glycerophosphotransferase family protein [bacterium]|nr:CDP-glycerol glycerophosphotransferase family protein [bacterium]